VAAALYPWGDSWYSILLEAVDPRILVPLEGFGQLKIPMISRGIEPAAFQLINLT
jgi:hypothetical protein